VHHLAPPPPVARLGEPAPPEVDRFLEGGQRLLLGVRPRHIGAVDLLEHESGALTLTETEAPGDSLTCGRARIHRSLERETEIGRSEHEPVLVLNHVVLVSPVVEPWLHRDPEAHGAPHDPNAANEPLPMGRSPLGDGHEVRDLAHPLGGEEARDQDVRLRQVELPRRPAVARGSDAVVAAVLAVEDGAEDARGVEARAAVPVDRAVGADQGDRVEITDDAVFGDRQIVVDEGVLRCHVSGDGPETASVVCRPRVARSAGEDEDRAGAVGVEAPFGVFDPRLGRGDRPSRVDDGAGAADETGF